MSNFLLVSNQQVSGPVEYIYAKNTHLMTQQDLKFLNGVLSVPVLEADSVISKSDINFKSNVSNLNTCLHKLLKLQGKLYEYKHDPDVIHSGFIAQEIQAIFPHVVKEQNDHLFVNYTELIPIITETIKEVFDIITTLETKLSILEEKVNNI